MSRKTDPLSGLTPKQVAAVFHIAHGASNPEAADAVGVDRVTMWRWSRLEHFQAALNTVQLGTLEALQRGWIARVPKALSVFDDLLSSENDSVRFRAAQAILDRAGSTEFKYEDLASILRADAKRLYTDNIDSLVEILIHMGPLERDESPEGEQRQQYIEKRMEELGLRPD